MGFNSGFKGLIYVFSLWYCLTHFFWCRTYNMVRLNCCPCHLQGHLFTERLVNSPKRHRCKQASETASHVPCNCEALATLRFRPLCHHFMQPGDFEIIPVSRILHSVPGAGPLDAWNKGRTKDWSLSKYTGHSVPALLYLILIAAFILWFW